MSTPEVIWIKPEIDRDQLRALVVNGAAATGTVVVKAKGATAKRRLTNLLRHLPDELDGHRLIDSELDEANVTTLVVRMRDSKPTAWLESDIPH